MLVLSLVGAIRGVRGLDALESALPVDPPAQEAWSTDFEHRQVFALGRWVVPAQGSLRVTACARERAPERLRVQVIDLRDPSSPRVSPTEPPLSREAATSSRCATGVWRAPHRRPVMARLVAAGDRPPALESLEVRVGGSIGPHNAWPLPLLVLALVLMVMAPTWSASLAGRDDDDIPAALGYRELHAMPEDGRQSHAPAYYAPAVMLGRAGPLLALVGMLGVIMAAQVPAVVLGTQGVGILASVLVQHALFVAVSAVMLGALRTRDLRGVLELRALPLAWVGRSVLTGLGLLAVALVVGVLLRDPGDSPMGRAIESTPVRYVIAYTALLAPLPEELFYRGVLVNAFRELGATLQVVIAAAVFAGMHAMQLRGAWLGLVPIALLGLVNGYLRVRTRRLVAPWIVHTVYNGMLASSVVFVS